MVKIRKAAAKDRAVIYEMLQQCDFLTPYEIELELARIDQMLFERHQNLYFAVIAEADDTSIVGYASFGPKSKSKRIYYIYKLISSPVESGQDIQDVLINHIEGEVLRLGGCRILTDLPSEDQTAETRDFYLRHHYTETRSVKNLHTTNLNRLCYAKIMLRP